MKRRGGVGASRRRVAEWVLTWPSLGWLLLFFVLPTLMIFEVAFRAPDGSWTLSTLRDLFTHPDYAGYPALVWRTVWLSAAATAACIVVGIPVAYQLARMRSRWRNVLLLLTIVPFWTNFVIRIHAWRTLLHINSPLAEWCRRWGLLEAGEFFDGPGTVWLVMVYNYLPFAILPLYAAAEKFDFSLLEAARDLGATSWGAFVRVFIPGIRRGVVNATILVLIPGFGGYVIPKMLAPENAPMIGNKIADKAIGNLRDLPHAAGLGVVLMGMVIVLLGVWGWWGRERRSSDE